MAIAAETWGPDTLWEAGGGGTAWDSFAYDPELDLLYVGVGNGSPWNQQHRDPSGGDNLYLSSIVALDPDDGTLVWHYQTTPGEGWDYTATQHIMLADLEIDGVVRQTGFDITAASEVMAILALATSPDDLRARLGRIVVGYTKGGEPVTAEQLTEGLGDRWEVESITLKPYPLCQLSHASLDALGRGKGLTQNEPPVGKGRHQDEGHPGGKQHAVGQRYHHRHQESGMGIGLGHNR